MNVLQLKRLETYGFKSFADKIEIDFDKGITAIVGPNGSGKSNITDAIRWVLGEQNVRNLRGTKAEDIIFTGSAARRALGVAEVSLVFDNDGTLPVDFKEVVITRRLFRSGESEFYINKGRCRLKDIYNLFADTGLGHDGMSIIGQNKIDEILNSKPEERRLFFEETAGITKYRNRKRESVRKLEDTEKNLVRVTDILQEIDNQLEPLAASAAKTREYNELQEDYKNCRLTEIHHKYTKLSETAAKQAGELQDSQDQVTAAETSVRLTELRKEELGKEILDLDRSLQELAEKNNALRDKIEGASSEIQVLEERGRQSKAARERILAQRAALEKEADTVRQELGQLAADKEQRAVELSGAEENLAKQKEASAALAQKLREQRELCSGLDSQREALTKKLMEKQNELLLIERDIENSTADRESRETEAQTAATGLAALEAELQEQTTALEQAAQEQAGQEADREAGRTQLQQAETEAARIQEERVKNRQELHAADSKLQFLRNMQQSYEGFGRAAKAVLKSQATWAGGVCGAVAELLQVPQQYITAIETALGSSQQNVVTEDTNTAKAAIAFLKKERLGRVTFLPLQSIVVRTVSNGPERQDTGVIGYANEIVGTDAKYKKIADFLLSRTLVVDTLDHALALAKKHGYRLRIVTLEGELLNPGGSLSGGSQQHREASFLNRGGEISALEQKTAELSAAEKRLEQEQMTAATARQAAADQLTKVEQMLQALAVRSAELRVARERLQAEKSEKAVQLDQLQKLAAEFQQSFAKAQEQRVAAARQVRELETEQAALQAKVDEAREVFADLDQDADDLGKYINDCEVNRTVLEQELLRSQERALLKQRELEKAQEGAARTVEEEKALENGREESQQRLQSLRAENEEWQGLYDAGQKEHKDVYAKRMAKLVESQNNDQAARDAARKLSSLQNRLHQLELAASQVKFSLEQCAEQLLADYGLTPERAAECALELSPAAVRQHMQTLEKKMADLGPVNPNAVQEYEELSKRSEFMQKQSRDLIAAKDNLLDILREMDITMTKQFKEAFQKINTYFGEIFVKLFGGGEARILLTDEANVLEAGVEIEVQLPEKKRQNLSALSGGERALTVIALLFSFLRYRPSPFSVLDEIDAPLDEANISRFGSFLRDYAAQTQFIIVTHRKGTMEAADAMYGVTIEDAGVSKILSVRLNELEN